MLLSRRWLVKSAELLNVFFMNQNIRCRYSKELSPKRYVETDGQDQKQFCFTLKFHLTGPMISEIVRSST